MVPVREIGASYAAHLNMKIQPPFTLDRHLPKIWHTPLVSSDRKWPPFKDAGENPSDSLGMGETHAASPLYEICREIRQSGRNARFR